MNNNYIPHTDAASALRDAEAKAEFTERPYAVFPGKSGYLVGEATADNRQFALEVCRPVTMLLPVSS